MRPGEGITGSAAAERAPIAITANAHLDPRFKQFPNLPEDEYESILAVPILAREKLAGALNVRTREPREWQEPEIDLLVAIASQVAQTIEHAKLYAEAQRRVHELEALAKISEAVSESLYLEESLEAIVTTTMTAVNATGAALVLEDGRIAWPEGRAGRHAVRLPLRWKRRQIGELVCDRDVPFTDEDRQLLEAIAHHAAVALEHGRAVMRGVLAQEIHHRVKNNLQTVASLLRLQARSADVDPRKALTDSVNRILAIAAVHEVLTEHREDDVDLGELIDRLRAMLVQGLVAGKEVEATLEPVSLAGERATALALVFSELFQNALEHGGSTVRIELAQRNGDVTLAIADDGAGLRGQSGGTGLSIVERARARRARRHARAAGRAMDCGPRSCSRHEPVPRGARRRSAQIPEDDGRIPRAAPLGATGRLLALGRRRRRGGRIGCAGREARAAGGDRARGAAGVDRPHVHLRARGLGAARGLRAHTRGLFRRRGPRGLGARAGLGARLVPLVRRRGGRRAAVLAGAARGRPHARLNRRRGALAPL